MSAMGMEGPLICLAGCFAGVASKVVADKQGQKGGGGGSNRGGSNAPPPMMLSSPGRGLAALASPTNTKIMRESRPGGGAVDLGKSFLIKTMADFKCLGNMRLDMEPKLFINTLSALIGESKFLQNNPRLGVHPEEKRAVNVVLKDLDQFSKANGGPLVIEELEYEKGRTNLKITYPGTTSKTVAFIGSHFDVVPANAESWSVDPFSLKQDGDKLYGRGTTDCLGHVAVITRFLVELAKAKPQLKQTIVVLFIAGEEGGETGVGVDKVVESGKLEDIKNGPVYWVDCADSEPCLGTCGALTWTMKFKGRLFHSGFPHKGINSIELASEALAFIQDRFYQDFPPLPDEDRYQFGCGSTMKPTQMECQKGSFNQICPETTVHGDIRLSPFYDVEQVVKAVEQYVAEVNDSMEMLGTRGPFSQFVLADDIEIQEGETRKGLVELKWNGDMQTFRLYEGIACNMDSVGNKAIVQAMRETYGSVKPFSINGTLPLVKQMQRKGYDLQLCGFGLMAVYHGIDEYCLLSEMKQMYEVLTRIVSLLETQA